MPFENFKEGMNSMAPYPLGRRMDVPNGGEACERYGGNRGASQKRVASPDL
jgi:hypothetical protein